MGTGPGAVGDARGSNFQIAGWPDERCDTSGSLCSITAYRRTETFRALLAPDGNSIILQGKMRQKRRRPEVPVGA